MLPLINRFISIKTIWTSLLIMILTCGLASCSDRPASSQLFRAEPVVQTVRGGKLAEVAPPTVIEQLRRSLEQYQPQVQILSPQPDQVLTDTTVSVQIKVGDLPIFQDSELKMGPHLHLILDNEPYRAIYDVTQPIIFSELEPGTHTLRVFASRPWHESFKNDGAYAQTTFHVLTKTGDNSPDPSQPLLTYSRPKGSYGAEPIMLDFYLTNAPLHLVAQENPEDEIVDWRIRVTINGESFLLDNWQPVYLKGFERGENWVQLEFLDDQGNQLDNTFNTTVRLINYEPKGQDTLSKLVRGELSVAQAQGIVDPNYRFEPLPTSEPTEGENLETEPEIVEEGVETEEQTEPTEEENLETEPEIFVEEGVETEEQTEEELPLVEPQPSGEETVESEPESEAAVEPLTSQEVPSDEIETTDEQLQLTIEGTEDELPLPQDS